MAGIIYNKQIEDTLYQGTGEKCLVLEPYTAYQVPFSFGKDWSKIRLAAIWSFTSTTGLSSSSDAKYNTPITDTTNGTGIMRYDAGGVTNVSNSFFGIMRDNDVKSLPFDPDCSGFIGWQGNAIDFSSSTGTGATMALNKLYSTQAIPGLPAEIELDDFGTKGKHKLVWTTGTKHIKHQLGNQADAYPRSSSVRSYIAPRTYGLANPYYEASGSGIDPSASGDYASFWGLEIERKDINDGGTIRPGYQISPFFHESPPFDPLPFAQPHENQQYADGCRISDASTENLRNIINGKDISKIALQTYGGGVFDRQMAIRVWNTDFSLNFPEDAAIAEAFMDSSQPDSIFFYNGFSDLYIRIHSWAVLRIE